jgi:molybdate transport system substrate-binding protein
MYRVMYRMMAVLAAAMLLCVAGMLDRARAADIKADIKVLAPGSTENSFGVLVPQFIQSSGHGVTVVYGPVGGLAKRLSQGEAADVAILSEPVANELRAQGKLVAGSETIIAKVGIGVFVRKGDPKPDISTYEAFTKALMNAKAITYSDPSLGGTASIYVAELLDSLDVTGSIKSKTKLSVQYRALADFVANGGADFGLNQITEILADPRLELVGPLPEPVQKYTYYAASLIAGGANQIAGQELIGFLGSPEASAVMRSNGFEPL